MITHVAILYNSKVYALAKPNRHHNVIRMIAEDNGVGIAGYDTQGFVNDKGYFLNRKQAYRYAKSVGQLDRSKHPSGSYDGDELYSEDLW